MRKLCWLSLFLVACGGGGSEDLSGDLKFKDANNYYFFGDITLGNVTLQSGANASLDWCALTTDVRGRPMTPEKVNQVLLVEVEMTPEEAEVAVEVNDLQMDEIDAPWFVEDPTDCIVAFNEFNVIGTMFVPEVEFVEGDTTWLLSVIDTSDGRMDILMSTIVDPTEGETNTEVVLSDGSSTLVGDADLHSAPPLRTQAGLDSYTLDWSAATTDVNGDIYDLFKGDRLIIGKVATDDISVVEQGFLQLDVEADELYYLEQVDGVDLVYAQTSADLMLATSRDGTPFGGFTTDGIWLVGVECLSCTSPAPLLLSVVEVEE